MYEYSRVDNDVTVICHLVQKKKTIKNRNKPNRSSNDDPGVQSIDNNYISKPQHCFSDQVNWPPNYGMQYDNYGNQWFEIN